MNKLVVKVVRGIWTEADEYYKLAPLEVFSFKWIDEIVSCIRGDKVIAYYEEMYFPDK